MNKSESSPVDIISLIIFSNFNIRYTYVIKIKGYFGKIVCYVLTYRMTYFIHMIFFVVYNGAVIFMMPFSVAVRRSLIKFFEKAIIYFGVGKSVVVCDFGNIFVGCEKFQL